MVTKEYKLVCKSGDLKVIYDILVRTGTTFLDLEASLLKSNVDDFLLGKRDDLATFELKTKNNGTVELSFQTDKEGAKHLESMFKDHAETDEPLTEVTIPKIPAEFVRDYVEGRRDSLITIVMSKLEEADLDEIEKNRVKSVKKGK